MTGYDDFLVPRIQYATTARGVASPIAKGATGRRISGCGLVRDGRRRIELPGGTDDRDTRFTELLGCSVPIQQAAMGGVATPELARAVAEAGGLGMVAGVMVPPALLEQMLDGLRKQTSRPCGVNFLMPFLDREAVAVAASRVRVVEFFYGDPDPALVELAHRGGALACWQVGSRDEAIAAAAAGCDPIVAQGNEAGGTYVAPSA